MTAGAPAAPRATCDRCLRPASVCVCALLPRLAPRTRVLVLQHPRERRVAVGTARMAARCLEGAAVVTGTHLDAHPVVAAAISDPARPAVLLWPGPDARDLAADPPAGPVTLVVVDGTWFTAKKLVRLNPAVAALPRYGLSPARPSEYRIRREPRAECLSTIEALAHALGVLEGDAEAYRAMMRPFRAMVDVQVDFKARVGRPRDRSRLERRRHRPWAPPAPLADPARVVLVACESNAWPVDAKQTWPDEVVQWLAVRGDGSARLETIVRPSHPLSPTVQGHTGLAAETLERGAPREALAASFAAFLRPGDVVVGWGPYARGRMAAEGFGPPDLATFDLRTVVAGWLRASPGPMEALVGRLGLDAPPRGLGRGGRRLGHVFALYRAVLGPRPVP